MVRLAQDLGGDGGLASDHVQVVVGCHQRRPAFVGEPFSHCSSSVGGRSGHHDVRAQSARRLHLVVRDLWRHHHCRGDPERPRRPCDGLRMVACGVSDDAGSTLRLAEPHDAVESPAHLERTRRLEAFGLDQDRPAFRCGKAAQLHERGDRQPGTHRRFGFADAFEGHCRGGVQRVSRLTTTWGRSSTASWKMSDRA